MTVVRWMVAILGLIISLASVVVGLVVFAGMVIASAGGGGGMAMAALFVLCFALFFLGAWVWDKRPQAA